MPTYEYECRKCGHRFEKFQSITARAVRKCPECGGAVRRLLGAGAAVISRGSTSGAGSQTRCGLDSPCCGRDVACETCPQEG